MGPKPPSQVVGISAGISTSCRVSVSGWNSISGMNYVSGTVLTLRPSRARDLMLCGWEGKRTVGLSFSDLHLEQKEKLSRLM